MKIWKEFKAELHQPISPLLLILIVVFVAVLIMSNVLANHMLQGPGFTMDAGTLTFPITYILSDVFSEVYGYKWSRRVTYTAAALNFIFALLIMAAIALPQPDWYDGSHFALGIGSSMRIVIASILSFSIGDWVNDIIFRAMKRKHKDLKGFTLRAVVSSFGGQIVDTNVFVFTAFAFTMPFSEMWPMIYMGILLKTGYEIVILPLTSWVTKKVQRQEDIIHGVAK